ncbi:bestrophin-like domain [Rhodoblastus sp.]|uniref:bestrophin-like domain n=1 Tax=Rhodoblastus sp. TaxID=1962975 RepID=UPI003F9C6A1E
MIFVYRAAIVAGATFVSALAGFAAHWALPAAYMVESKSMVGSVLGLVASLLSLVLSLLIWTSHNLATSQQAQLQTLCNSIIRLDFMLESYGCGAKRGRALLREHVRHLRKRLWYDLHERRHVHRAISQADLPEDMHSMIAFFVSLRPANDEQRQYLASARDIVGAIIETQLTMIRSLDSRAPLLLLVVVLGWSCVLFFGYGLLSDVDALTIAMAALGAICVASAVLLILEQSDPYSGLFRMPQEGFDGLIRVLMKVEEMAADAETGVRAPIGAENPPPLASKISSQPDLDSA